MPMLEEEARKRRIEALNQGSRVGKIALTEKGRPSEHASKMFNVGERYIREVKKLQDNGMTDRIEAIRKGETIKLWNGLIVDGHNRYNLCQKNNVDFKTIDMNFKDRDEVCLWIINNQLGRRNLLPYDRVRLGLKKESYFKKLAKGQQGTRTDLSQTSEKSLKPVDRYKEIGKIAKVSHDTVAKVKYIESQADEETKKELSKGD